MSEIVNIIVNEYGDNPQIKIVKVAGQLDETSLPIFSQSLEGLLVDTGTNAFVLDFSELEFLNSKVIGYLADYHSRGVEANMKVVIAEAPGNVMDILELVGMTYLIPCQNTINEAIEEISE